jgi:tetratricopeptide (TPR) repeat protein
VVVATLRYAWQTSAAPTPVLPVMVAGTSRTELSETVRAMTARLTARPDDGSAVVRLSDALLRLQRVNNDGRAVITAESHLRRFLQARPSHYEARRMLAAVLLARHRFGDAIAEANRARAADPRDAWNYGAIGDGYMELGDYERAFEAFDRMGQLAPGPSAYARTSYALEIKGDLDRALEFMRMAADGTSPNDAESLAWHFSQIGDLLMQLGRIGEARLAFERAAATFPYHPLAVGGLARVKVAEGEWSAARLLLQGELAKAPTLDLAATIGDLSEALGDHASAASYFRVAEQIERAAWDGGARQPEVLAKFLVDHNRDIPEAVRLAEEAARSRRDIFTMDTLAVAYLNAGRLADARRASDAALRTGSRDARLLWHAAKVRAAANEPAAAVALLRNIPALETIGDVRVRAGIRALQQRLAH